jgi:hypothetical protein
MSNRQKNRHQPVLPTILKIFLMFWAKKSAVTMEYLKFFVTNFRNKQCPPMLDTPAYLYKVTGIGMGAVRTTASKAWASSNIISLGSKGSVGGLLPLADEFEHIVWRPVISGKH